MTRQLIKVALVNLAVYLDISVYIIVRISVSKCLLQHSSPHQVDCGILFLIAAISPNLKGINRFGTKERVCLFFTQFYIFNSITIQINKIFCNTSLYIQMIIMSGSEDRFALISRIIPSSTSRLIRGSFTQNRLYLIRKRLISRCRQTHSLIGRIIQFNILFRTIFFSHNSQIITRFSINCTL